MKIFIAFFLLALVCVQAAPKSKKEWTRENELKAMDDSNFKKCIELSIKSFARVAFNAELIPSKDLVFTKVKSYYTKLASNNKGREMKFTLDLTDSKGKVREYQFTAYRENNAEHCIPGTFKDFVRFKAMKTGEVLTMPFLPSKLTQ